MTGGGNLYLRGGGLQFASGGGGWGKSGVAAPPGQEAGAGDPAPGEPCPGWGSGGAGLRPPTAPRLGRAAAAPEAGAALSRSPHRPCPCMRGPVPGGAETSAGARGGVGWSRGRAGPIELRMGGRGFNNITKKLN